MKRKHPEDPLEALEPCDQERLISWLNGESRWAPRQSQNRIRRLICALKECQDARRANKTPRAGTIRRLQKCLSGYQRTYSPNPYGLPYSTWGSAFFKTATLDVWEGFHAEANLVEQIVKLTKAPENLPDPPPKDPKDRAALFRAQWETYISPGLDRIRQCLYCNRWLYARRQDQKYCSGTDCRARHFQQSEEYKEWHREEMRLLRCWRNAHDSRKTRLSLQQWKRRERNRRKGAK